MPTLQHANGALGCALTPREHQITSLVSAGFSNKERITHKEMKP
jgi:DNA-binding CsgD family transcriptional regulator